MKRARFAPLVEGIRHGHYAETVLPVIAALALITAMFSAAWIVAALIADISLFSWPSYALITAYGVLALVGLIAGEDRCHCRR